MNSEEIDNEIKKLYKAKDKAIEKEFAHLVGQCYHPTGLDVFIYVKAIRGRNVDCIEINNGDIFKAVRNYEDHVFHDSYKEKPTKFRIRLRTLYEQLLEETKIEA